jgi:hypothetical protein
MPWSVYNSNGKLLQGTAGIANVVEDTTPQLGGNLDMQARLLVGNGGSTGIAISANGEVTMAAQPVFMARNATTINNVTGDGTAYVLVFSTEVFDQNADFDGVSTFTAPITGRYRLSFRFMLAGLADNHTEITVSIIASNGTSLGNFANGTTRAASGNKGFDGTLLVDMDASDTATISTTVTNGSKVVDLSGQSLDYRTNFSGELVA